MKINLIAVILALSFFSSPSFSTEYIYRDLMANTVPSAKCETQAKAEKSAEKSYKIKKYSKSFVKPRGTAGDLRKSHITVQLPVMNVLIQNKAYKNAI